MAICNSRDTSFASERWSRRRCINSSREVLIKYCIKKSTPICPAATCLAGSSSTFMRKAPITLGSRKNVTCLHPPPLRPSPLPPLLVLSLSLSQHPLVGPSSITVKLVTISLYSRVSPYLRGSSPPDEDTAGARFYMYVSRARARARAYTRTRANARARRGLKKCVRTHARVYVYISTRMFPLKNEPVPVPHGRNTARKVSGVTGSIGGLLSINNVIIGC